MAVLKNSRNTQLASTDSAARIITTQKTIEVTSNTSLVNYTSSGTLVAGQTLQVVAKLKGMSASIQWQLSSPGVKLYLDSAGVTEVTKTAAGVYQIAPTYVALTDSFDAAVWVLASEFNTQALTTLRVTALATDSEQVSGFVNFIKLQASPGSSTFTASLYLQSASLYQSAGSPPPAPTGGSFNFTNSTLTAPALPVGTAAGDWWKTTQPATSTSPTWACEYNFTGTSVDTVTAQTWKNVRIDTVTGSAGTRTAVLDLYRWVNAADVATIATTNLPSGKAVYTWSNATFVAKSGDSFPNSTLWKTTPDVPVGGQTLYIARQVYADTGSSLTSEVTWSTAPNSFSILPIASAGSNGTRTAFLEIYRWVSGTTAPTVTFAANSVSPYTWADGTFTLPTNITAAGWSLAPGAAIAGGTLWAVGVSYADTGTTSPTNVTWPQNPVPYVIGAAGAGGVSQNRVELYWQATTVTAVNTATRYTFSSDTLTTLAGGSLDNWQRTPPSSSTTPTWVTSCLFTATAPLDYDDRDVVENSVNSWSTPVVYAKNGVPGINGTKTWPVNAFLWAQTPPTIPSLDVTFTWSDKSVSAYPIAVAASGGIPAIYWTSSAPGAPGNGYTLYQITFTVTADVEAATTNFNWSSATRGSVGYRVDGTIGPTGDSARVAYTVTTSSTVPGTVTPGGGDVVPTGPGTWSFSATSTLTAGQYMYQVDGILSRTTGNITWGNPYLSNLKVGSLSAITANVGNLTIASGGNIQTKDKGYGEAGGFFIGYDNNINKFSVGDKLKYDGTTFSLPGVTLSSNGTLSDDAGSRGQVTIRGVGYTGDLNAAAGTRLVVTGTGLTLQGNSCSRTSGTSAWNAQCYSRDAFTGGAVCSFSAATATGQAVVGLSVNPTENASYESVTYGIYLDGASNEVSIREFGSLPAGFTNIAGAISTTDVFTVVYDGQFIRYAKNGTVFRTAPAPAGLTLYFDSSVYTVGGGLTNIQLSAYSNTNTSRGTSLVDPSWWKVGVDPGLYWAAAGEAGAANGFVAATLPDGSTGTVWQATSGASNWSDNGGGWVTGTNPTNKFPVNTAKTYMFAVYTKSVSGQGSSSGGISAQEYFGIDNYNTTHICNLNTETGNINPYFASTNKVNGEWHLLVGYVYPAGSTGYTNAGAGAYRCSNGVKIADGSNWTWAANTTETGTRAFQYYQPAGSIQQFAWPQVYLCDGTEPSIDDLLSMSSISARNPLTASNKITYGYSGDLNATYGATAGTNLKDSGGTVLADSAIKNTSISINANGTLVNAGSGQVTVSGLGYRVYRIISKGGSATTNPTVNSAVGLFVDGVAENSGGRSYNLTVIRRSDGVIVSHQNYDVFGEGSISSGRTAATLATDLNALTSDYIVVVFTQDEPQTNRLTSGLPAALYRCGASRTVFGSSEFKYRSAYALVGIAGCGEGNGAEFYQGVTDSSVNAWIDATFSVVKGSLTGVSGSYTPSSIKDYGYIGELDATKGAPTGTVVGSILAENVESTTGAQGKADTAQSNAAADATTKANAVATAAAADATAKANAAQTAAETAAQTKATLAEVTAKAYADGIVTAEETRAIADATAKANAAQTAATTAAAADATAKANAVATAAAADATAKANAAATAAAEDATAKAALKLNKSATDTLSGRIIVSSFGGVVAGDLTWNSVGERTGGQGVAITPKGIVGHNGTKPTFTIDVTTGDANFDGTLAANTVTAASVQAGAITAAKINITNGSTSSRVVINSNQILVYDSNNNVRVKIGSLI